MKEFTYTAAARNGTVSGGTVIAADRSAALDQIEGLRLQPISLVENHHSAKRKPTETEIPQTTRLKPGEVLEFTEELSELLRGGIPLEKTLSIIERRDGKSRLPVIARLVKAKLRDGKTLSDALRSSSKDFGELYCRLVSAGEESGALSRILQRQAKHLRALQTLKSGIVFALIYPAFLCVSAVGVLLMFVTFLIPKLMELLESTGGSLPAGAELIIRGGEFMKSTWGAWVALLAMIAGFLAWFSRNHRLAFDRMVLRLPVIGKVLHLRQQVLFLETMASLTENGLPVVSALALTRNTVPSPVYQREIDVIRSRVQDGEGLSNSMVHSPCFSTLLTDLISVGEETGDLPGALGRASSRFDTDLGKSVERISAIIQPSIVILMAAMVGCMAYLMISAIFKTVSGLGA